MEVGLRCIELFVGEGRGKNGEGLVMIMAILIDCCLFDM